MKNFVFINWWFSFLKIDIAFALAVFFGVGDKRKEKYVSLPFVGERRGLQSKMQIDYSSRDTLPDNEADLIAVPTYDATGNEVWECGFSSKKSLNLVWHQTYNARGGIEKKMYGNAPDGDIDFVVSLKRCSQRH